MTVVFAFAVMIRGIMYMNYQNAVIEKTIAQYSNGIFQEKENISFSDIISSADKNHVTRNTINNGRLAVYDGTQMEKYLAPYLINYGTELLFTVNIEKTPVSYYVEYISVTGEEVHASYGEHELFNLSVYLPEINAGVTLINQSGIIEKEIRYHVR